jgi:hypothetical protein
MTLLPKSWYDYIGRKAMKLPTFLSLACFVVALFDVGLAMSQASRPSQAVSAAHQQAMEECKARYGGRGFEDGGPRGRVGRDQRYAYIEACFKEKTGLSPFQANVNCTYRPNDPNNPMTGRNYFC